MKRATLTAYPTARAAEPADFTDRLLQAEDSAPTPQPAQRKRRQSAAQPAQAKIEPANPTSAPPAPAAASGLSEALAATEAATASLRQAAREAPARYEVALHYRLDALAHHLQQVKDYVAALAAR
jgi:hypothetical protein